MIAPAEASVAIKQSKSSKRKSREQRRRERERARRVESRLIDSEQDQDFVPEEEIVADAPATVQQATAEENRPEAHVRPGLIGRLFGRGPRPQETEAARQQAEQMPSLLRPIARREYGHERTLSTIREGFENLSDLMCDIRDGLEASVEKQGELLEQLRYLPIVAEQNARSSERLEDQLHSQNRLQMETIKAIREQSRGQFEHQEQLAHVLSGMNKITRDQKLEIDDMEARLERMRQSEQAIADNLSNVGTAVRRVSEQGAQQNAIVARMQEAFEQRTRQMEQTMRKQATRHGLMLATALVLGVTAVAAVAAVGYLYLRSTGAI